MRYVSTRGRAQPAGFIDVLLGARAPDGGLWLPQTWPQLLSEDVEACAGRPLAATAADLLTRFAGGELDPRAVDEATREAAASFTHAAVDPLKELLPNLWLHDLTHGPTGAAADFEMQVLARLIEAALVARRETRTLVLASAGDDAGAAVEAFAHRSRLRLIVLFPDGRLSRRRLLQIAGSGASNIRAVAVDGDYAACRGLADGLFADDGLAAEAQLASIGPDNVARVPLQAAAWLAAAARLGAPARAVTLAAPAGEASLAFAAWAARRMGLPVARIVVGTNASDGMAGVFSDGRFARGDARPTRTPELDVAQPLALERLYFEAVGRNAVDTERAMRALAEAGHIDLPPSARAELAMFAGASADDVETARTLVQLRNETGEMVDPATAVVVSAARRLALDDGRPVIAAGLAHPAICGEAVHAATGETPALPRQMRGLDDRAEQFERLPADPDTLKRFVRAVTRRSRAA
jgi:threonine synthase